jgi:hypothetical protein
MSPEKDKELCEKYPKIFRDRNADMSTTAMCWGFDCGDGWYNIIDKLCGNIQSHIDWRIKSRKTLLETNPHNFPVPPEIPQVVAVQVKEKFGGLRFYYNGGDEYISGLTAMAASMSYVTCEECGKPGKPNSDGWIRTTCEEHK